MLAKTAKSWLRPLTLDNQGIIKRLLKHKKYASYKFDWY